MFELTVETTFAAAHQLRGYKGKCERMHGHNWKVHVHVVSDRLDSLDMVIDFHELKRLTNETVSSLDHTFLNDVFPFTEKNPSSENIAKWIFDSLQKKLAPKHVRVSAVTVWESDSASATYYED
ncbi:MAG: 6-carboxytetrahydropterin synthase QueD [Thermodesulfovibrionales bacterium]